MKNFFYSESDSRLRAGWRIVVFSSIVIVAVSIVGYFSTAPYVITVFLAVFMIGMLKFAAVFIDKRPFSEYGLRVTRPWIRDLFAGIAIAALAISIIYGIMYYMDWVAVTGFADLRDTGVLKKLLALVLLMTCVSVWEEAYFRGYLILNIREGFHTRSREKPGAVLIAVVISSILFSLGHFTNPGASGVSTLNLIVAGMVLAYPYVVTGSLALSVGIHLSWNYFQGALYGLPVSGMKLEQTVIYSDLTGPAAFTGGAFGPEAGASGLLGLMILVALTEAYLTRFYKK